MIGAFPFSDEPISGLPSEDDASTGDPLSDLLSGPQSELAFMLVASPYDPALGVERTVCLSSHGYASLDDGTGVSAGVPDHTPFSASLMSAYNVKATLLQGATWQANALPGNGAVIIANPDGVHDDLLLLDWELRRMAVWVGRKRWIGPSWKTLARVLVGTFDGITWDTNKISLSLRDLRQLFDKEVNPEAYLGFGTAVRFRAAGDRVTVPYGAWMRPLDGGGHPVLSIEFMVSVPAAMDAVLATQGGGGGWACRIHSDWSVGLYDRGVTNWVRTPAGVITPNRATRLGFYGDATGLSIRIDGPLIASNAVPYAGPVVVAPLVIGGPYP